jgi:hypothetical protein
MPMGEHNWRCCNVTTKVWEDMQITTAVPTEAELAAHEVEVARMDGIRSWCTKSAIAKHSSGKVGEVLNDGPDGDFEVELCWADGAHSGWISAMDLSEASAAESSKFRLEYR